MSTLIPGKRSDLLDHYMALPQGENIQAECTHSLPLGLPLMLTFPSHRHLDRWYQRHAMQDHDLVQGTQVCRRPQGMEL